MFCRLSRCFQRVMEVDWTINRKMCLHPSDSITQKEKNIDFMHENNFTYKRQICRIFLPAIFPAFRENFCGWVERSGIPNNKNSINSPHLVLVHIRTWFYKLWSIYAANRKCRWSWLWNWHNAPRKKFMRKMLWLIGKNGFVLGLSGLFPMRADGWGAANVLCGCFSMRPAKCIRFCAFFSSICLASEREWTLILIHAMTSKVKEENMFALMVNHHRWKGN